MEPVVVAVCDKKGGYQWELERQLADQDVEYLCVYMTYPKFSWHERIVSTQRIAAERPGTYFVFVDAWDTLFLGTKEELVNYAANHLEGITFAAAKKCWPDDRYKDYALKYENDFLTPWRYLNSNPMAGTGKMIAEALAYGLEHFPLKSRHAETADAHDGEVCERFYTKLLLDTSFDIRLDMRCVLNQIFLCSTPGDLAVGNYAGKQRMANLRTNTLPLFVHFNGKTIMDLELFR